MPFSLLVGSSSIQSSGITFHLLPRHRGGQASSNHRIVALTPSIYHRPPCCSYNVRYQIAVMNTAQNSWRRSPQGVYLRQLVVSCSFLFCQFHRFRPPTNTPLHGCFIILSPLSIGLCFCYTACTEYLQVIMSSTHSVLLLAASRHCIVLPPASAHAFAARLLG